MTERESRLALLGFSIPAMAALQELGRQFVGVVPAGFEAYMEEHGLPYVTWDFQRLNEKSGELYERLSELRVSTAVPLFEETVEWAGALNGRFRDDPRLFTRYLLFRDKAMMKRRAQMCGVRVGVFEEAENHEDVRRFLKRVNLALTRIDGDPEDPIHLKPLDAAGSKGHRMIRSEADVLFIRDEEFPCLLETHLEGQEFSCEAFVHEGRIRFLNITEYVKLGHSNFVPASPRLEEHRDRIQEAVQALIRAFEIEYGMIHPEFFIQPDGTLSFGEVAARVPGGHIFELIERAYGFSPFAGFALCADPSTTEQELTRFFPEPKQHQGYAGCLMVYPRAPVVTRVSVPDRVLVHPYYDKHNLFVPANPKVAERVAFGDHYGTIYFQGDDADEMRALLTEFKELDYYASDAPAQHSTPPTEV